MRIGAVLKGTVEPGNQRNLFAHYIQRRERGGEGERMAADRHGLALEPPHVVLPGKLRQRAVAFAREKPAARDAVGQVIKRHAFGGAGVLFAIGMREALQPW